MSEKVKTQDPKSYGIIIVSDSKRYCLPLDQAVEVFRVLGGATTFIMDWRETVKSITKYDDTLRLYAIPEEKLNEIIMGLVLEP